MDTTLFIYESVYALAEGANSDHVVGKEATQLEFEDVYATALTDTFINWNGKSFIKIITNVCCDCV